MATTLIVIESSDDDVDSASEDEAAVPVSTRVTPEVSPTQHKLVWPLLFCIVSFHLLRVLIMSNIATISVCFTSTCHITWIDCAVLCLWRLLRCGFIGKTNTGERNMRFATNLQTTRQYKGDQKI